MDRRNVVGAIIFTIVLSTLVEAQSTATPSFFAPYRAFTRFEFGGTVSFPEGGNAYEGNYSVGSGRWDLGFRGGVFDPNNDADLVFLAGVSFRSRIVTHTVDFPLDGALVLGAGGRFVENGTTIVFPGGISLGRQLNVEDSNVSIVPYAQPTVFITAGENQDVELRIALGFGADFRFSRSFDARVSLGLGDVEGIALSLVWVR